MRPESHDIRDLGSVYDYRLGESVKILVALSILFTYGLQFTVPSEIVWKKISHKIKEENHDKCYYLMRACMILGTGAKVYTVIILLLL